MSFKLDKPAMFSIDGYKRHSKDVNNKHNIIASGDITMKDVDFPVHGIDNLGNEKIMEPGKDYSFPGDIVLETPLKKNNMGYGKKYDSSHKKYEDTSFKMSGFPMHSGTKEYKSHLKQKKPDWSKAPKPGTQERTLWYQKHKIKLDETTPKLEEYPIYVDKFQEGSRAKDSE